MDQISLLNFTPVLDKTTQVYQGCVFSFIGLEKAAAAALSLFLHIFHERDHLTRA